MSPNTNTTPSRFTEEGRKQFGRDQFHWLLDQGYKYEEAQEIVRQCGPGQVEWVVSLAQAINMELLKDSDVGPKGRNMSLGILTRALRGSCDQSGAEDPRNEIAGIQGNLGFNLWETGDPFRCLSAFQGKQILRGLLALVKIERDRPVLMLTY